MACPACGAAVDVPPGWALSCPACQASIADPGLLSSAPPQHPAPSPAPTWAPPPPARDGRTVLTVVLAVLGGFVFLVVALGAAVFVLVQGMDDEAPASEAQAAPCTGTPLRNDGFGYELCIPPTWVYEDTGAPSGWTVFHPAGASAAVTSARVDLAVFVRFGRTSEQLAENFTEDLFANFSAVRVHVSEPVLVAGHAAHHLTYDYETAVATSDPRATNQVTLMGEAWLIPAENGAYWVTYEGGRGVFENEQDNARHLVESLVVSGPTVAPYV